MQIDLPYLSVMLHSHERVSSKWSYITGTAYCVIAWIILTIPPANALC